jgi:hypothetical protein
MDGSAGKFDEGRWGLHHRDQIIASYFVPLPEPLGFPDAWHLPLYERPPMAETDSILNIGEFVLVPLSEESVPAPTVVAAADYPLPADERNWSNKVVLRTSVMLHRVGTNFATRASIDAAHAVASRATAGRFNVEDAEPLVVGSVTRDDFPEALIRESMATGVGIITVAEIGVPIHMLGRVPEDLNFSLVELAEQEDRGSLPTAQDWPPYVRESDFSDPAGYRAELAKRALNGLRMAIADVRDLQSAYAAATRAPITLVTYESLPPVVPIGFRQLRDIGTPDTAVVVSSPTHKNLWSWLAPADLTSEQYEMFGHVRSRTGAMAFAGHLDLYRKADVARKRDGDTRATAIYAGLSAEAMLDELLLHLMWEEALTPEDAATSWRDGLLSRVKRDYTNRLGGDWDITSTGAIARWSRDCADLRHRAVHGGHLPSYAEIDASISALDGLLSYACDRLCLPGRLRHYPRTALALAGPPGLRQRSQYSRRLVELQADLGEPNWDVTFARWKEVFRRVRRQLQGIARTPDASEAELIAVAKPSGAKYYCLSHSRTGLAIEVGVDSLTQEQTGTLRLVAEWLEKVNVTGYQQGGLSFGVPNPDLSRISIRGDWVEAYHLLPLAGVMVDKSDLQ